MNKIIKYEDIPNLILHDKRVFETFLDIVKDSKETLQKRIAYAQAALKLAVHGCTSYFYSDILENFFTYIAQKYSTNKDVQVKQGTILHVLTAAYLDGGHTRVVERWIKLQKNFSHSVVLISQGSNKIPKELVINIENSGGKLYVLDSKESLIEKAIKLREIALSFQYIILHIHMDDPTANIAFGTDKFIRPVLLFNHADHIFWIGQAVADMVIDFRKITGISKSRRNIHNTFKLPIPSDFRTNTFKLQLEARKELNIDEKAKVIVTAGSAFKYKSFGHYHYFDVLDEILEKSNADLYVIGVSNKDKNWKQLSNKHKQKLHLVGKMPYSEYVKWLPAADLLIDSYPVGGGTVLNDAIVAKVPFVSWQNIIKQTDFVLGSLGMCSSKGELVEKSLNILNNKEYAKKVYDDELLKYKKDHSSENWLAALENIFANIPDKHCVKYIEQKNTDIKIDEYCALLYYLYKEDIPKKKNFLFFTSLRYDKVYEYYVFGHKVFTTIKS